jgi:hypothetical protein
MKLATVILTIFVVLFIAPSSSCSGSDGIRFLREENNAHDACKVVDLTKACPDDSVVEEKLHEECKALHSIAAAKCYMNYLCVNHDQETVNEHKKCIDEECPLATRMGEHYDCEKEAGVTADETSEKPADEEVAVDAPKAEEPKKKGGMGLTGILIITVVVGAVVGLLYVFRDKWLFTTATVEPDLPELSVTSANEQIN